MFQRDEPRTAVLVKCALGQYPVDHMYARRIPHHAPQLVCADLAADPAAAPDVLDQRFDPPDDLPLDLCRLVKILQFSLPSAVRQQLHRSARNA